jgi:hypothetical protein
MPTFFYYRFSVIILAFLFINCEEDWDFSIDGGQLLVQVEEFRGGKLTITTYEYDDFDRPILEFSDREEGELIIISSIGYADELPAFIRRETKLNELLYPEIPYHSLQIDSLFYNEDSKLEERKAYFTDDMELDPRFIFKETYIYSKEGLLDTSYYFSSLTSNVPSSRTLYTWEDGNMVLQATESYENGTFEEPNRITSYEYGKGYNPYLSVLPFFYNTSRNNLINFEYVYSRGSTNINGCPMVSAKRWDYDEAKYPISPKESDCGWIKFMYQPITYTPPKEL